jgi:FAD/FMN-containing dehydrogenase/Fe-S oxidoreductase
MNHHVPQLQEYTRKNPDLLLREFKNAIEGEVRFDEGSKALYATDSSNYRQVPIGVIIPKSEKDVIEAVRICRENNLPVLSRGGGTSLAGQTTNFCVVLDFSKYLNKVFWVDPEKKLMRVQPGAVIDQVNQAAHEHGLRFGPDPSTHVSCTVGGMIGNNSCGVHSVLSQFQGNGARTSDNLHSLKVLTYQGNVMEVGSNGSNGTEQLQSGNQARENIYQQLQQLADQYGDLIRQRFPKIPRRVSGYNLDDLLPENNFQVARSLGGSEGTCNIILEATLELVPNPKQKVMVVVGFEDVYAAGDFVPEMMKHKPVSCEGMDHILVDLMRKRGIKLDTLKKLPEGNGWLLSEFGGDNLDDAMDNAKSLEEMLRTSEKVKDYRIYDKEVDRDSIWLVRESGLGVTAHVPGEKDAWEGWEDSAVPPEKIGDYMRDLRKLFEKFEYGGTFYGHFGQGIVHTRINFGLKTEEGIAKFRKFIYEAGDLVVKYGGSFSGEHGDGQSRAEMLEKMYGPELIEAFRKFKKIWDPDNQLNPGKVVNPYRIDENLRLGTNYNPPNHKTHFSYPRDNNNFAYAIERCVGVGKCRKTDAGTMCPSYMATREEKYTTRGRARMLFEMLNGKEIKKRGNWRDEEVKDSLEWCLACKACKSECPVSVDMATYKAEFNAQYYKGRLKPAPAYAMGLIDKWASIASHIPGLTNFLVQNPITGNLLKKTAGLSTARKMPTFHGNTFRRWFRKDYQASNPQGKKVILWPDTFNNYLLPESMKAACEVLDRLGYQVIIPTKKLCCGRPLYDFGMLKLARKYLQEIMDNLKDEIEAGTPVVGLEPSCVSVFRDELMNLFPDDEIARRLSKSTRHLSEFLIDEDVELPEMAVKAVVHGHCHHEAVLDFEKYGEVLGKMKVDFEVLDDGCCGLAGSFGYQESNYDISEKCAKRKLIPAVEEADSDTVILSDGYSCREQIMQFSDRKAITLPELILKGFT